jgi:hypothetical protein
MAGSCLRAHDANFATGIGLVFCAHDNGFAISPRGALRFAYRLSWNGTVRSVQIARGETAQDLNC